MARPQNSRIFAELAQRRADRAINLRAPFTIASLAGIFIACLATGALWQPLSEAQIERWGLGPASISNLRLWGLFTANYLVDKPVAIISTVVMVVLFLGWVEVRYGWFPAAITWFASTWASTLLAALAWWPFALFDRARPLADVAVTEVGSSAATWSALGVALGWPGAWSGWSLAAGLATTAFLTRLLAVNRTFTDLEHVTAFAFGTFVLAPLLAGRARPVTIDPGFVTRLLVGLSGATALLTAWVIGGSSRTVAIVAGVALLVLSVRPASRWLTLLLLAIGGVASVMATPNPATIGVYIGAIALLLRPMLAGLGWMRVR